MTLRYLLEWRRIVLLALALALPFALVGGILAGAAGAQVGVAANAVLQVVAYAAARPVLLRAARSRLVDEGEEPELVAVARALAASQGVDAPLVAVSELGTPNAFAFSTPCGGVVGVTRGLLQMLTPDELEAVIAHELAHLRRCDRASASVAAVLGVLPGAACVASGVELFYASPFRRSHHRAWGGRRLRPVRDAIAFLTAPLVAGLARIALPRACELRADRLAVVTTGRPAALATALRKLDSLAGRIAAPVNPALAHLFLLHPFGVPRLSRLFDTHPPLATRLAQLRDAG